MKRHLTSAVEAVAPSRFSPAPRSWQKLTDSYPEVVAAYDRLSDACRGAGPLDEAAVAVVKLAVSVGCGADRTVHAHAKKALRAGVEPDALRQVALAALPTVGLPAALDALLSRLGSCRVFRHYALHSPSGDEICQPSASPTA